LKLILGLTGPNASGKGEIAQYLQDKGFAVHSLSDIVREEAAARGLAPERENLIRIGNLLREEGGARVLAQRILSRLGERDVVDSIRNPAEVVALRELPHFTLLGVQASWGLRFERSCVRGRPGDPTDADGFKQREAQENTTDPRAQQLQATFEMADRIVVNEGNLDQLRLSLDQLLTDYLYA
jgi:dephospho-CoA kinase